MTLLLAAVVKTSCVLLAALAGAAVLRHRSADVRHWLVAAGVVCSLAMPLLMLMAPAWPMPPLAVATPPVDMATTFSIPGAFGDAVQPPAADTPKRGLALATLAIVIWFAGALAGFAWLTAGLIRLRMIAAAATCVTSGHCVAFLEAMAAESGVRQPVRLLLGDNPVLMVTWGVLRPTVLLPAAAEDWPDDRLRVVLSHELAHIRRGDWGVQLAAATLRALYWFNPLVWLTCRVLRRESEQACDDAVLHAGVAGPAYAAELLDLAHASLRQRRTWTPALPVARSSGLERRVHAMLDTRRNRSPLSRRSRLTTALAMLGVAAGIAGGAALAQGPFATVSGSLVDQQRAALADATLVMTNTGTQAKNEVRSDANGRYEFVGLPPGNYVLDVTVPAFRAHRASLALNGDVITRDIVMNVGTVEELITVTNAPDIGSRVREITPEQQARMAERAASPCVTDTSAGGGKIQPPMKIRDVRPVYPASLGDADVRGTVVMDARIGIDGSVRDVAVTTPAHPALDASAMDAVRQWQFTETLLNCVPIEVAMTVTVNFRSGN